MKSIESLNKQLQLIELEKVYDQRSLEEAFQAALQHSHLNSSCWFPIKLGGAFYNALNQYVLEIEYAADFASGPDCEFEPGKSVTFFQRSKNGSQAISNVPGTAMVQRIEGRKMQIALDNPDMQLQLLRLFDSGDLGVRIAFDDTTYQVMEEALHRAKALESDKMVHLREVLIGSTEPQFRTLPAVVFGNLNKSQNEAVQRILEAREVAVVHGPPGTGKTTTLVEAIIETTRREPQVLVCAPSNAAIDWISEKLLERGVAVVRIGNPLRISNRLMEHTYERQYAAHPDYPELWGLRKLIRDTFASETPSRQRANRLRRMQQRREELEVKIHEEVMQSAEVITCTLIGSAHKLLGSRHFGTLFIDEATQALEAACWAAILRADRVIFAGDHQQLPPTILSPEAERGGLADTLMQKVVQSKPACVSLLDTQYRMNRQIMRFSSEWFYAGRLKAAPEVANRTLAPWDAPLVWVDTADSHFAEKLNASQSRSNREEAKLLVGILKEYVRQTAIDSRIYDETTYGVISPYKAQVSLLRHLVGRSRTLAPVHRNITVNTVDGFQGQERDVILISMVRDNERGAIGFLKDLRRMNVAITRARMKLIIVGNSATLAKHDFYARLFDYVQENGIVRSAL
ncbi:MAG: AAA family ATPase [Bacteroidales bacterium]|nr:AAA family ATPase [Bacteroidales bacterium]